MKDNNCKFGIFNFKSTNSDNTNPICTKETEIEAKKQALIYAFDKYKKLIINKYENTQCKKLMEKLTIDDVNINYRPDNDADLVKDEFKYFPFGYSIVNIKPSDNIVSGYQVLKIETLEKSTWTKYIPFFSSCKTAKKIEVLHCYVVQKIEDEITFKDELRERVKYFNSGSIILENENSELETINYPSDSEP